MDITKRALYPIDGNGKITVEDILNESSGGGDSTPVTVDTLSGATTTGKALMKAASQEAARAAINAGISDFSGNYEDLTGKPTIPAAATVDNLSGAGATGRAVMKATSAEAARSAIGAGTGNSNLELGSTASTAKPGNYQPTWDQVTNKPTVIGAGATQAAARQAIGAISLEDIPEAPAAQTWSTLSGKPAVIAAGSTQEAARQAIGAGTSNLVLGTTAGTAKAGNYVPSWNEVTGKPAVIAAGVDQAAARAAIGAGTSNLTIGTTADTAMAGNYTPPVVTTSANGLMSSADKTKLNGIAASATANSTDAQLRDRSTHTGTQAMSTISGLAAALDDKATVAALALLEARIEALENAEPEG